MSEIFKIQKNGNYTAMSNIHLQDKRLSLKAKGLLSLMLSLPADRWKYSIRGLASICRDGVDSVRDGIRELERAGYVIRFRARKANGQLSEAIYWIYEEPQTAPRNGDEPEDAGGTVTSFDIPPEEEVAEKPPASENPISEKPVSDGPMSAIPASAFPITGKPTSGKPMPGNPTQVDSSQENPMLENTTQSNNNRSNTQKEKIKKSNTNPSNPNQSNIHPSIPASEDTAVSVPTGIPDVQRRLNTKDLTRLIKDNIEYAILRDEFSQETLDNIVSLMVEVLSTRCEYFTVSGKKVPAGIVHARFLEINSSHIQYIFESMEKSRSKIHNIRQYWFVALFNAPATMHSYYEAEVRHDYDFPKRW